MEEYILITTADLDIRDKHLASQITDFTWHNWSNE